MNNSPKTQGEKGQLITIGELAKWDIQIAMPLSDNLPFDFIAITKDEKLFKVQVKSSARTGSKTQGAISFKLTTNNWHNKTEKKYSKKDVDIMILCDYNNIYLLGEDDFDNRSSFDIRFKPPANNQKKGVNLAEDFIISEERINAVFV